MARASSSSTASPKRCNGLALTAVSALVLLVALPAAHAARPWAPPPPPAAPTKTATRHRQNNNWPEKHHERKSGGNSSSGGRFGATQGCDETNWYIPKSKDMVTKWVDTCGLTENTGCGSCELYRLVVGRAAGTKDTYIYSQDEDSQHQKIPRSKIVPVAAMSGLESIVSGVTTSSFWVQALGDAKAGNSIQGVPQTDHAIAFANSLDAREQHQLHIHIGAANRANDFYNCAKSIIDKPPSAGSWSKITTDQGNKGACAKLASTKEGVAMAITTASAAGIDAAIRDGFRNKRVPAAQAGEISKDAVLLRTGVLVEQLAKDSFLVALIYNTNDFLIFGY